jgi:transcription elongation GreA/GreB family factor
MKLENLKNLKKELLVICHALLQEKQKTLQEALNEISESINTETKSSAGDKHETARARMQFEQDKLTGQLNEITTQINELKKIDASIIASVGSFGSIVLTDKGTFFISVALGKLMAATNEVYAISPVSPLAKVMMGLLPNTEFIFSNRTYKLLKIS